MAGGTLTIPSGYPNPQPSSNSFTFGDAVGFDVSATVFIRQRWGDVWQASDKLVCTSVNWAASPTVPTATLVYRYGQALEQDGSTINVRPKLSLPGWYVRIEVNCPDGLRLWHGFIDDVGDEPNGFVKRGAIQDPVGTQTFSCVGMIAALDRSPILNCYFKTSEASQGPSLDEMRVANSAPHFNPKTTIAMERGHEKQIKNKAGFAPVDVPYTLYQPATPPAYPAILPNAARKAFVFHWANLYGAPTDKPEYWSPREIVKYLVAFHGPRDELNKERIPVWLYEDSGITETDRPLPTWGQPELDCQGKTLKEALDELMSQKNSLGYWAWVEDSTNRLMIEPFTVAEADLSIGTGKTIKANQKWLNVMAAGDPSTAFTMQSNVSALANQVVIRGAKRVVVCELTIETVFPLDTCPLEIGWTSAEQAAYEAEFPDGGAGETLRSIYSRRDALEQGKYRHLYRNFVIGKNWNWKTVLPNAEDIFRNDDPDVSATYVNDNSRYLPYPLRMRILSSLPFKEGIDFVNLSNGESVVANLASVRPFRDIEVYGKTHGETWNTVAGTMTGKPCLWSHHMKRDILYDTNDPDYTLDPKPLANDYGLGLRVDVSGASQLIFSPTDPAPHISRLPKNSLLFVVAIEDDRHVSQHWPATSLAVDGVLRRVFEFGEAYQLIEIAKNATLGITATTIEKNASRFFLRDDRDKMLELAKQLHKWYSTSRNIIRVTSRRSTAKLWPGQLFKKINPSTGHETDSNCVVTEVALTLPIGTPDSPGKPTFSIVTSRGEVDPLFFEPRLR